MAANRKVTVRQVEKSWLSAKEACAYLGCSLDLLETLRNKAEVTFSTFGRKTIWYEKSSIDAFLYRNAIPARL